MTTISTHVLDTIRQCCTCCVNGPQVQQRCQGQLVVAVCVCYLSASLAAVVSAKAKLSAPSFASRSATSACSSSTSSFHAAVTVSQKQERLLAAFHGSDFHVMALWKYQAYTPGLLDPCTTEARQENSS